MKIPVRGTIGIEEEDGRGNWSRRETRAGIVTGSETPLMVSGMNETARPTSEQEPIPIGYIHGDPANTFFSYMEALGGTHPALTDYVPGVVGPIPVLLYLLLYITMVKCDTNRKLGLVT